MDTANITKLVQNRDLEQINRSLGVVSTFFWITYANFAAEGLSARQAVDKTFSVVNSYFAPDVIQTLSTSLGQARAA